MLTEKQRLFIKFWFCAHNNRLPHSRRKYSTFVACTHPHRVNSKTTDEQNFDRKVCRCFSVVKIRKKTKTTRQQCVCALSAQFSCQIHALPAFNKNEFVYLKFFITQTNYYYTKFIIILRQKGSWMDVSLSFRWRAICFNPINVKHFNNFRKIFSMTQKITVVQPRIFQQTTMECECVRAVCSRRSCVNRRSRGIKSV